MTDREPTTEAPHVPSPPGDPGPSRRLGDGDGDPRRTGDPADQPPADQHPAERHPGDPGDRGPGDWDVHGDTPSTAFPVPWTWPESIGVALLTMVGASVALAVLSATAPARLEALQVPLSGLVVALATIGWVAVRHRGHVRRLLGPVRPSWRHALAGVGHGIAGFIMSVVVFGGLLQVIAERMGADLPEVQQQFEGLAQDPRTLPYLVVAVVLMAPIGEELFFRGFLFQALRRRVHLWPAIGLSGLAFSLVHVEPLAILVIFPLGLYLGWAFHRSGSLLTAITAHAVFNAITLSGLLLAGQGPQAG